MISITTSLKHDGARAVIDNELFHNKKAEIQRSNYESHRLSILPKRFHDCETISRF